MAYLPKQRNDIISIGGQHLYNWLIVSFIDDFRYFTMNIFDTCTIQAFEVFNGKTSDEPPLNTDKLIELSKADIIQSIIDTIIEDAVSRDSLNKTNSNDKEIKQRGLLDSKKNVDNFQSIIVKGNILFIQP